MATEFNQFEYIISIDLGTTFSGSCYSYIGDKERIVHVVKWPEQSENDKFEKTPTACLYRTKNDSPPELIKWGKAAFDYVVSNNEPDLLFIDQFKLKLQDIFKQQEISEDQWNNNIYIRAAVDYLREIHKYTCEQLVRNMKAANQRQIKYVLTVPATWINRDTSAMRSIAVKAGIIDEISDPPEKLLILSEAHAASLFCEREYCMTKENKSKLYKGQRYLICDAGGGTIDLAAYECTTIADNNNGPFSKSDHCQLALESGGSCGSTILDKNMENYLRNEIFFGCIEDDALKNLVDQFVKEIKHYFGSDEPDRNNYMNSTEIHHMSDATESLSIVERESNTTTTCSNTKMVDIVENDYDYNQDYETHSCEEDGDDEYYISEDDFDVEVYKCDEDEEMFDIDKDKDDVEALSISDYVYFTLPSKGIDPSILENLSLKGSIVNSADNKIKQLRISHQHITKHIFDPVVVKVIDLIEQQIKKSHTTIHTLFLLGGFGQSPYLYKKLHEEFITNTNSISHLIVPEDGYRSSMRGGIHYGLDDIDALSLSSRLWLNYGNLNHDTTVFKLYRFLVAIDFDFYNLSARFSIIETSKRLQASAIINDSEELNDTIYQIFSFDSERFLNEYNEKNNSTPGNKEVGDISDEIYLDCIIVAFMEQLFKQIQQNLEQNFSIYLMSPDEIRYTVSFSSVLETQQENISEADISERIPKEGTNKIKDVLLKLIKKKDYTTDASYATVFTIDDHLTKEKKTKEIIWYYVFAAAKHIGMINVNSHEDVFLKNKQCIYGSFLACKSRLHKTKDPRKLTLAMMLRITSPNESINAKLENFCTESNIYSSDTRFREAIKEALQETALNTSASGSTTSNILSKNFRSLKLKQKAYIFEIKNIQDEDMSIVGRLTKMMLDVNTVDAQELFVLETKLNFYRLQAPVYWDNLYGAALKSRREQYLNLYNSYSSIPTVEALLCILVLETDFMSVHFRKYLKEHVDLSHLQETHTIKDLFIDPLTGQVAKIVVLPLSDASFDIVAHGIYTFAETELTTETILNELLITWIKYRLVPAMMDQRRTQIINSDYKFADWCVIVSGEIIETKSSSNLVENNVSTASVLYDILKSELESYYVESDLWSNVPYIIYHDTDITYTRHMDALVHGLAIQENQLSVRISERRYAVHFVKYYKSYNTTEESYHIIKGVGKVIDSQENNLVLYPLIQKSQLLQQAENCDNISKFCVKSPCYLSAVLYGSEDESEQEYVISNNSFKKLHRFIIPVNNPEKTIDIGFIVEKNSILFTIKQDEFESDYRCYDYRYYVDQITM